MKRLFLLACMIAMLALNVPTPAAATPDYVPPLPFGASPLQTTRYSGAYMIVQILNETFGTRWDTHTGQFTEDACMGRHSNQSYNWNWNVPEVTEDPPTADEKLAVCKLAAVGPVQLNIDNTVQGPDGRYVYPNRDLNRYDWARWVWKLMDFQRWHNAPPGSTDTYRMGPDTPLPNQYDLPIYTSSSPGSNYPNDIWSDIGPAQNLPLHVFNALRWGAGPAVRILEPASDRETTSTLPSGHQVVNPPEWGSDPRQNVDGNGAGHLRYAGTEPITDEEVAQGLARFACASSQQGSITPNGTQPAPVSSESAISEGCWDLYWRSPAVNYTWQPPCQSVEPPVPNYEADPALWGLQRSSYWIAFGFNEPGMSMGWDGSTSIPALSIYNFGHPECTRGGEV